MAEDTKVPGVNLEVALRCPKGTKMTKAVKTLGAILKFKNNAERKHFCKLVAKTQHEAAYQAKYAKVDRSNSRGPQAGGEARNTRPGEASTAAQE